MRWALLTLIIGVVLLYATDLEIAPVHLHHDEVLNALNAQAIASSGRDPNGRLLPLYFYIRENYWATPVITYTTALLFTVLPVSEVTIRLASVMVAMASVSLMYAAAKRMFEQTRPAVIAAVLLALTPAHFIHGRLAVDQLYPLPFVIGWLWCLASFFARRQSRALLIGGLLLGVGLYTYLAALVMMPVYVLLTWVALYKAKVPTWRPYAIVLCGFLLPALLLVPWHLTHPQQFGQQLNMYAVYDADRLNPLQGLKELASYTSLSARSSAYHAGFNPSMLFFSGGSSLINGTQRAGVFLFSIAALLPAGIYAVLTTGATPLTIVLLCGVLSAPLAGAVVNDVTVNRMLVILPFAILLSTVGAEFFLTAATRRRRLLGIVLLALAPLQFSIFHADYMGDYRLRSAFWFERNIRGALETIISTAAREPTTAVYLSERETPWITAFWRFYLLKHGRTDLLVRTVYFDADELDPKTVPSGAAVLSNADSAFQQRLASSGRFPEQEVIREPDERASFIVFRR